MYRFVPAHHQRNFTFDQYRGAEGTRTPIAEASDLQSGEFSKHSATPYFVCPVGIEPTTFSL